MSSKINRRDFFKKTATAGAAGCILFLNPELLGAVNVGHLQNKPIDPKKLNYCGYTCPENCQFLVASVKNDPELKRKVYDAWKVKEIHGVEFDADKIFCFGCKVPDEKQGVIIKGCGVRKCCIDKGFDSCIQCKGMADCQQDLWKRFPDFKKELLKVQQQYQKEQG
jgi:hypothetical protein